MRAKALFAITLAVLMALVGTNMLAYGREDTLPTASAPGSGTPGESAPGDPAPADPTPGDPTPGDPAPAEPTPAEPTPGEPTPGEPTPGEPTPGDPTPGDPTPGEPTPGDPTPGEPTPGDPTPGEPTPGARAQTAGYALLPEGASVYSDIRRDDLLGTLPSAQALYARLAAEYERGDLYEVLFDTDRTLGRAACETGYFYSANLRWLDGSGADALRADLKKGGARSVDGERIPAVAFAYAQPQPTEQPDGETTQTAQPPAAGAPASVAAPNADVHSAPDIHSERLAQLDAGTSVEILDEVENSAGETWCLVRANDVEGYVRADLLAMDGAPPAATDAPVRSIVVTVLTASKRPTIGDQVTLRAELFGFDGLTCAYSWEYAPIDEAGNLTGEWIAVDGADQITYSYTIAKHNLLAAWRMRVTIAE